MITAKEAAQKAQAYNEQVVQERKDKAVQYAETEIGPLIEKQSSHGHRSAAIKVPTDIVSEYIEAVVQQNGYATEWGNYNYLKIDW